MNKSAQSQPARINRSLNGEWEVHPGETLPGRWSSKVPVPGLIDLATPAYPWQTHSYHWYRTRFPLEREPEFARAILRVEQAMFGTEVFLNGHPLGGDIACYTSQEYDLTGHLRYGADNELMIRVGNKETLPPESAVGKDQERQLFIPGIWGDVSLLLCGDPSVSRVQMIPHIGESVAEARVTLKNSRHSECTVRLVSKIREHLTQRNAASAQVKSCTIQAGQETQISFSHRVDALTLWSPERPYLYEHVVEIFDGERPSDCLVTRFGMREFRVDGGDFLLNGQRIFLRGGNIAFHRFLSDADRQRLPWDMAWVKKLLIEIPKAHNFNFFRNHIGQLYNRWYDVADEGGMLIQNEWMFWTTTGSEEQITREFTRWLQDNWNHPSIVIWDALNECTDALVQEVIVPKMKGLDPTRPWESVDFTEDHPYIYSLGPVLTAEKFGFARALDEIEHSPGPSVVNEFLWWWLDKENNPTQLTREVMERWLGAQPSMEDLIRHQCFLGAELVELFRRMRLDAIQPFVYLSNNAGPTGNWFLGEIGELRVKPLLATLKNAFAPFGISLELWDRHFFTAEDRNVRVFVFNDHARPCTGEVRVGIRGENGEWTSERRMNVEVSASGCSILPVQIHFPAVPGGYTIEAELAGQGGVSAVSRKPAFVLREPSGETLHALRFAAAEGRGEVVAFVVQEGAKRTQLNALGAHDVIIVEEGMIRSELYRREREAIARTVAEGGTLLVLEPEFGVKEKETVSVLPGIDLAIERRADTDKGGYDSYVFASDPSHPLWKGIEPDQLKMFNGGLGGEIVSQHSVSVNVPLDVLARCGLNLAQAALFSTEYKKGLLLVCRMQMRGRLLGDASSLGLYGRRRDPVARQLLRNLLSVYSPEGRGVT
ncbi:MAG TPA: glycoside hydrolase family 2 TIM barrel-domain containing protein [Bacteroidota bacterium]|nr:glycoside hydrolase family 2 TIM barrel-domain containing protein [Bacteroidota bacterium]